MSSIRGKSWRGAVEEQRSRLRVVTYRMPGSPSGADDADDPTDPADATGTSGRSPPIARPAALQWRAEPKQARATR